MARQMKNAERVAGTGKNAFWYAEYIFANYDWLTVDFRLAHALVTIQVIYYPLFAIIAVPVNVVTIVVLSRGKCGLSKGVTHYLVAMATADLLVVVIDLILRQLPIVFQNRIVFLWNLPVCNIHAVLLYATTDCSVWFTVTFTFDRFVAICCQNLKIKYCTERTAAVVVWTIVVLSCLKNIFWYFMLTTEYVPFNIPWFCRAAPDVYWSVVWGSIELLHYILTPVIPLVLVLLLNVLTIRHVLVASRARGRLRGPIGGESPRDPEMEKRSKSLILLLVVSGNFILLWVLFTVYAIWTRLSFSFAAIPRSPDSVRELGSMLQLLSCCTNTALYAVTQTHFRKQLKELVKSPVNLILVRMQR